MKLFIVAAIAGGGVLAAAMALWGTSASAPSWAENARDWGLVIAGAGLMIGRFLGIGELSRHRFSLNKRASIILGAVVFVLFFGMLLRLQRTYFVPFQATMDELQAE